MSGPFNWTWEKKEHGKREKETKKETLLYGEKRQKRERGRDEGKDYGG